MSQANVRAFLTTYTSATTASILSCFKKVTYIFSTLIIFSITTSTIFKYKYYFLTFVIFQMDNPELMNRFVTLCLECVDCGLFYTENYNVYLVWQQQPFVDLNRCQTCRWQENVAAFVWDSPTTCEK